METIFHGTGDEKIAEVISDAVILAKTQDALDIMANPALSGSRKIILHKENIAAEFFDLSTKIAGDVLQKFVNYRVKLAVVGDFRDFGSDSLKDFITECNRGEQFFFVEDIETAVKLLTTK